MRMSSPTDWMCVELGRKRKRRREKRENDDDHDDENDDEDNEDNDILAFLLLFMRDSSVMQESTCFFLVGYLSTAEHPKL